MANKNTLRRNLLLRPAIVAARRARREAKKAPEAKKS